MQLTAATRSLGQTQPRALPPAELMALSLNAPLRVKFPSIAVHHYKVAELAGEIARALDLPEADQAGIRIAASVHDIGKLTVPASLLMKIGALSIEEIDTLQGHVEAGYQILRHLDFDYPVAEIVHQHHERFDGSGYPFGLSGTSIHIGARIIGVADAVETMMANRPYQARLSFADVMNELRRGCGTIFDPRVVQECMQIIQKRAYRQTMFIPPRPGPASASAAAVPPTETSASIRLTLQQMAVMRLATQGLSVKQIAIRMNLGIGTVKVHLSRAYLTLGARNRVAAVRRFLDLYGEAPPAAPPARDMPIRACVVPGALRGNLERAEPA